MEEDNISISPTPQTISQEGGNSDAGDVDNGDPEASEAPESGTASEKVFDISSDFNIVPVNEASSKPEQEAKKPIIPVQAQVPNLIQPKPQIPQPIQRENLIPKPTQLPAIAKKEGELAPEMPKVVPQKALRTYESDIADVLARKHTSSTTMVIAENRRRQGGGDVISNKEELNHVGKKSLLVMLSMVLILAGLGGAYYFYSISPLAPANIPAPAFSNNSGQTQTSMIQADTKVAISIDDLSSSAIINRVQSEITKQQAPGTIKEIIFTETSTAGSVQVNSRQTQIVTGSEMINRMGIAVPDILFRTLTPQWMLGVYADGNGNKDVFVIATTNFFQNAFAGMLQWEQVIADDLKAYLPATAQLKIVPPPILTNAVGMTSVKAVTTSSTNSSPAASKTANSKINAVAMATSTIGTSTNLFTTTEKLPAFTALRGHFEDRIIMNKDIREFIADATGQGLFLYSFLNNSEIAVAGKEATLAEILTRLEKRAFVR